MFARFTLALCLIAVPACAQAPKPALPPYEDQLYMIGRAQEQEINDLRKQVADLQAQLDKFRKGDPPADGGGPSTPAKQ